MNVNIQVPNLEEAANVAAEFISSIDNLPHEVDHILQEIKHKDIKAQELQYEIEKESARYIRHMHRSSPTSASPSPSPRPGSPKSSLLPTKISATYAEIQELAAEKCILAQRLIETINKTRIRLEHDITKVRILQGDAPDHAAVVVRSLPSVQAGSIETFGAPGRNPALAISESLRNALASAPAMDSRSITVPSTPVATTPTSTGAATKKRRITTTTSIKISPAASPMKHRSASPAATPSASHNPQKSRLSRQIHPAAQDDDMDAEGDEDAEAEDDNEDETLYCFCRKQSYGDMIACDNEGGCPYEWFHLSCVGLKQPTPEKWYCSSCVKEKGLAPSITTRKGRKK